MNDYTGQQFGKYRLTKLLERGGFADIYLSEHIVLGTKAAVKILRISYAGNEKENFLEEARTLSKLKHANIVRIHDCEIEGTIPFLAMEYASLGNVRAYHAGQLPLPIKTVVSYVEQIAEALQYAHEKKITHRDVKPENLLLDENNVVLLSDFGIATVEKTVMYTKPDIAGTVYYMAPEQINPGIFNTKPGPATDQYALGVVAYEWMTGMCPFQGLRLEVESQHIHSSPPSIRAQNATVPSKIETVILKALEKNPQKRFKTVKDFAYELKQAYLETTSDRLPKTELAAIQRKRYSHIKW